MVRAAAAEIVESLLKRDPTVRCVSPNELDAGLALLLARREVGAFRASND